jgi:hypothetical protein
VKGDSGFLHDYFIGEIRRNATASESKPNKNEATFSNATTT